MISTARELYLSLGAHTYVARCERELKAGGLHRPRGSRDDVELTPQEEAVTTLVAQGLSNREVAAELYVSPKTVQYHLTRIYAKLGVRSRAELAAMRRWRVGPIDNRARRSWRPRRRNRPRGASSTTSKPTPVTSNTPRSVMTRLTTALPVSGRSQSQ